MKKIRSFLTAFLIINAIMLPFFLVGEAFEVTVHTHHWQTSLSLLPHLGWGPWAAVEALMVILASSWPDLQQERRER